MKEFKKDVRYFLDTNIFLRFLIPEDELNFKACCELFRKIEKNNLKAVTVSCVLAEIVWVLQRFYKEPKHKIIQALSTLQVSAIVYIDSEIDPAYALDLFETYSVKYVDCLIASVILNNKKNFKLLSYDKDFDKLGIKRLEPKDII